MKTLTVPGKDYKDFSVALELYKLSKSARSEKAPRLRANDRRKPVPERKNSPSAFDHLLHYSRQEIMVVRKAMQKIFAFAHIH